jgi:hypothetical protein
MAYYMYTEKAHGSFNNEKKGYTAEVDATARKK